MKFLAIDTSGKRLSVVAENGGKTALFGGECAMQHSVRLFPEIERTLAEASLALSACDFLACVVGPGSFTGIRIGISAAKGMCFGAEKKVLPVTSFDAVAYAVRAQDKIAAVDAGHGYLYAKGYGAAELAAGYYPAEEVLSLAQKAGAPLLCAEEIPYPAETVDATQGLLTYCRLHGGEAESPDTLAAVYLRRSNAEEGR